MKPLSMSKQGDNNNNNDKLYLKQSLPHVTKDFFSKNGPGSTLKEKKKSGYFWTQTALETPSDVLCF